MTTSYKEYPDTKIVEIHVDGEVTREEFDTILANMNDFILRFGTIKLLESVATFKVGMDASMVWDGIRFDLKNLRHISHCAVVSDIGWISPLSRAAGAFMSTKLRTFRMDEIHTAREWLENPDATG